MPARSGPLANVVLLACLLAGVACTSPAAAPSPAAPSRGIPPRSTPSRAVPAAVGHPGWLITHPAHLYQLEGFADRSYVLPGASFRAAFPVPR